MIRMFTVRIAQQKDATGNRHRIMPLSSLRCNYEWSSCCCWEIVNEPKIEWRSNAHFLRFRFTATYAWMHVPNQLNRTFLCARWHWHLLTQSKDAAKFTVSTMRNDLWNNKLEIDSRDGMIIHFNINSTVESWCFRIWYSVYYANVDSTEFESM